MVINIKVIPRASNNEIIKIDNDNYKVRLTAAPVVGQANKELVKLLSKYFGAAKSDIKIIKGKFGREKVVRVDMQEKLI